MLHALALRGVRVHYLRKPSGDWLEILRLIRDEGPTPLQQGGCTPEQASRFNWALEHLSQGKDPPPWPDREVPDNGGSASSIVNMAANLPKRLCNAMQAALENSAGDGLVLALDQWELGSECLERPGFKEIFDYLLTPLRKRNSAVRVILSLKCSQKMEDPAGWHPLKFLHSQQMKYLRWPKNWCAGSIAQSRSGRYRDHPQTAQSGAASRTPVFIPGERGNRSGGPVMAKKIPSWLLDSTSLDDAVARLRNEQARSVSPSLWKRLSLVPSFDSSIYDVIVKGLEAPAF